MSVKGVQARAIEVDGTFVVLAGSTARADGKAAWNSYKGQRDRLIAEGKLRPTTDPEFLTFAEDISFASPSAAAAIVLDRNSNGRIEWRVEGFRQTYADWPRRPNCPRRGGGKTMSRKQRLELTWIGKDERPRLEPRILIEDPEKSCHAKERVSEADTFDNRLIFGDNLLALKALEQEFSGKVKCIYI